jgi:hypothetical protein
MVMNNELEWSWKETIYVLFKVLSQYLSAGSEEFHKKITRVVALIANTV